MFVVVVADTGADTDPIVFSQDRLLGRLKKENGETVCLLAHERALTPDIGAKFNEVRTNLQLHVPRGMIEKGQILHSRGILLVSDDEIGPTNPPTLFDVEIGWGNVFPA